MAEPRQNVADLPADRLRQLMARLRQKDQAAAPGIKPVERGNGPLPLSPSQESFWLLGRFAPESAAAHLPVALRLSGPLDRPALLRSFAAVARRHEPLRTTFGERGGQPFQTPLREVAVELPAADLSALPAARREPEMLRRATAEARRPFDLSRAPLFRLLLLRLGAAEHVLVVTLHHLVSDGWSLGVLLREIGALYGAFSEGRSPALPALPVQHLDYVDWQRRQLQGEALRAELEFWRARLDGLGALALAADRPRPPLPSFRGHQLEMALDAGQTAAADELAHRHGGTLFMVLLAAFQILLARYGGQTSFGVGTPVANRERTEVEGLIGLFVNTLVLRADLAGDPAGTELLRRVREDLLAVYPHGALPFETLAEELKPEREPGQNPFFQTLLALQNHPLAAMRIGALAMAPFELDTAAAKLDLSIAWRHQGERLTGSLEVNADVFEPAFAERLRRHYGELLRALAATPDRRLSELPMLSADERRQLVAAWNGDPAPPATSATPRCLHHLFAAQAARAPEAVALVAAGGERLTYGELDRRSDRLARRLAALGAGPETPVGVHLEPSARLVTALLAIWKAGGAYLPLDPALPAERLAFMLADSGAPVVITAGAPAAVLTASGARLCRLDAPEEAGAPEAEPAAAVPENLAWILYTSGSTGRPKAVGVAHAAAAAHLAAVVDAWALSADDRVLQFDAPSFDVWLEETLAPLLRGASLALRGAELWEPAELLPRAAALGVSVLPLPTAYWRQWVGTVRAPLPAGSGLRLAVVGGEAMTADAARAWWRSPLAGIRLLNGYGPTEAVISATFHEVGRGEAERAAVGLGLPLAGRSAFVLDPAGDLLPAGVPGELCLGGRLLARGYAGRPVLTAERFVPDPFAGEWGEAGGRLYRTGDRARRRPDGVLEFLGRLDQQVKIRGFRVELGEIEAALAAHPRVREAAVIARGEEAGNPLAAFVVTEGEGGGDSGSVAELGDELRRHLARRLPAHMIPPGVTVLPALPLTPVGKVDRRALAGLAPADRRAAAGAYAPPRDPIEELLAPLWAEVLGVERVGVHDDFFNLGGHSLLGMQLTSRVADLFGVRLTVRALFEARTVGGLAERIAEELAAAGDDDGILAEMLAERDGTAAETQEGRRESSHG